MKHESSQQRAKREMQERAVAAAQRRATWKQIQASEPRFAALLTELRRVFGPLAEVRLTMRGKTLL